MQQPELFAPDECRRVAALPHDQREWTRAPVDTSGPAAYIRAWVAPLSWWGARLPAAIATAHPTNTWSRFRARRRTH